MNLDRVLNQSENPNIQAIERQTFEQVETQQYRLILPTEQEQLRGYLENDGLLSDEEITRCLYRENLRREELAKRVEDRAPTATESNREKLTDYLWDVHQYVKGLPLSFIDPRQTYRVDVVDTPAPLADQSIRESVTDSSVRASVGSSISPVTLHLDINGGFLANFLHNAQLNHEQMNRFIDDLERQHRELKAQLVQVDTPTVQAAPDQSNAPSEKQSAPVILPATSVASPATIPDGQAADTAETPLTSASQPLLTSKIQSVFMNESTTASVGVPVPDRQTRYEWKDVANQFEKVGINRQELEQAGHLNDLLNGRKTGLMKLTQSGEDGKPFHVSGKLYIVNTPDQGPIIGIQPERKQLLVPKEFLGYTFSDRDKQNLEKNGEMGKRVELTDKMTGKAFAGYVGVDKETKSLTVLRAERLHIPQTVKGVTLNKQQQKNLEQGRAVKLSGMTGNNGQTFDAYVQVSAAKRSLTFAKLPDNAIKQTVDQKTAQDLERPVQQIKGDGAGAAKKTIQPKEEIRQSAAERIESSKPTRQQKPSGQKAADETPKPVKAKKQKGPRVA